MKVAGVLLLLVLVLGCGNDPVCHEWSCVDQARPLDMAKRHEDGGDLALPAMTPPGPAPTGFGTACSASTDCSGFVTTEPPGRLGCGSYIGVNYCTLACNTMPCWQGTRCECFNRVNVSGFPETDCLCVKP